jgi:peptide/nickel transport system substrate-binding protein
LHYAPPLQKVEISAGDFIRALERDLTPAPKALQQYTGPLLGGALAQYLSIIQGAQDFSDGKADTISGLEAPDSHTLRMRLTQAVGDLDYRLSLYATAPIPPNPFRPGDALGVAQGHERDGYDRVLVSSGPYMWEGSQAVDFSKPADQQKPASGYETLTMVRNPSWDPASDLLRKAYSSRIQFSIFDSGPHTIAEWASPGGAAFGRYASRYEKQVEQGKIDTLMDRSTPLDVVDRYRNDPALRSRLQVNEAGSVRYLSFNLAVPPFDDVHVRKAINYVMDKQAILHTWLKNRPGAIYDHLAPDRQENNLLSSYDPYRSPDHRGNVAAARREMKLSVYDRNHDGRCDGPVCAVTVPWRDEPGYEGMARIVKQDLAKIGIRLTAKLVDGYVMYTACLDSSTHTTLCQVGWAGDYPSASTYFPPLYASNALAGGYNFSLTGASPTQLSKWGYSVHSVPNVDARMNDCSTRLGADEIQCWAAFDQYMMEEVVPAVPLLVDTFPWTFSDRVASFSWSPVTATPALANIALKPSA